MAESLRLVSRTEYGLEELCRRPLPHGVDGTRLEWYLGEKQFEALFCMNKTSFYELPRWKQARMKKDCGLF